MLWMRARILFSIKIKAMSKRIDAKKVRLETARKVAENKIKKAEKAKRAIAKASEPTK